MKEAHITYKDEYEEQREGWFEVVEINTGYITFLTEKNKITIPMSRIIKVKERGVTSE